MKLILIIFLLTAIIFLSSCSNIPRDLYDCNTDSNCVLMSKNLVKKECCAWDSINSEYKDWYQEEVDLKVENCMCKISPVTEAVCHENKCKVLYVGSGIIES